MTKHSTPRMQTGWRVNYTIFRTDGAGVTDECQGHHEVTSPRASTALRIVRDFYVAQGWTVAHLEIA